eukprot:maker-scaffold134_size322110-snap-gene-0.9 protein:Tk07171 transcript:maker-scaffold134_size322110-snap-gene-0.9-mRNA-1 annotation:"AAEL007897-PA"
MLGDDGMSTKTETATSLVSTSTACFATTAAFTKICARRKKRGIRISRSPIADLGSLNQLIKPSQPVDLGSTSLPELEASNMSGNNRVPRFFQYYYTTTTTTSTALTFLSLFGAVVPMVDEFMSCDRFFENRRAARVMDQIPCDMSKQTAIWRFKEENRALMKRLYGDLESTSLYREMRSVNLPSASNIPSLEHHVFSSLEYNIRVGSGLATVQSAREPVLETEEPVHEIPTKKVVVKRRRKPSADGPEQRDGSGQQHMQPGIQAPEAYFEAESPLDEAAEESTLEAEESLETNPQHTTASPVHSPTSAAVISTSTPTTTTTTSTPKSTTSEPVDLTASLSEILSEVDLESLEQIVSELLPQASEHQSIDHLDMFASSETISGAGFGSSHMVGLSNEGKVNPESAIPHEPPPPKYDFSGPSVNACPVKEEVFAPYWANNTRNQVLALLNLYPFEQYIHMETCKFEEEQMMCRDGCRCEQQHRLHRLLAFDPSNECRGIFSKCYGLPPELAEGKRKPRTSPKRSEEPIQPALKVVDSSSLPAIVAHEHREQHLLRETQEQRDHRRIGLEAQLAPSQAAEDEDFNSVQHEPRSLNGPERSKTEDQRFFYATGPVLEYSRPEGTSKGLKKTPRKLTLPVSLAAPGGTLSTAAPPPVTSTFAAIGADWRLAVITDADILSRQGSKIAGITSLDPRVGAAKCISKRTGSSAIA